MKKIIFTYLVLLLSINGAFATEATGGMSEKEVKAIKQQVFTKIYQSFQTMYGVKRVAYLSQPYTYSPTAEEKKKDDKKKDGQKTEEAKKAQDIFSKLEKEKKTLPDFNADFAVEFPLLLDLVTDGNTQVAIAFNDLKIYPGYTEISMFVKLRIGEYTFFFGADKLKYLTNSSSSFFAGGRAVLLGDATYTTKNWTFKLKGGGIKDNGSFGDATSISINCGQMELLKLTGEVELSPEYFLPLDKKGKVMKDSTERVSSTLESQVDLSNGFKGMDDLYFKLNFTPFTLKAYKGKVGFNVKDVVFDFSDRTTPEAVGNLYREGDEEKSEGDKEDSKKEDKKELSKEEKDAEDKAKEAKKKSQDKEIKSWKGVYAKKLEVYLPDELKGKDKSGATDSTATKEKKDKKDTNKGEDKPLRSFGSDNLVIGDKGLCGDFFGYNVIRLKDDAPVSSWDISLDTVEVSIKFNSFKKFRMLGEVQLPYEDKKCEENAVAKDDKKEAKAADNKKAGKDDKLLFGYEGIISLGGEKNTYSLAATIPTNKSFGFLGGEGKFKPNSAIELILEKETDKNASFEAKATLNGEWSFAVKTGPATTENMEKKPSSCLSSDTTQKTVGFRKIEFTKCNFSTKAPYFSIGSFKYADTTNNVNNYPLFIELFEGKTLKGKGDDNLDQLALDVKFRISLMENSLSAKSALGVNFSYGKKSDDFVFKYQNFRLDEIDIRGEFSAFNLAGRLKLMRQDPDYGNGFMGGIQFQKLNAQTKAVSFGITTNVIFGKTSFRYLYIDGLLMKEGLFPMGKAQANGAGLGFAWNMTPTTSPSNFSVFNIKYLPKTSKYSLVAMLPYSNIIAPAVNPGDVFDGTAMLSINFGGRYGIANVNLNGDLRVKAKKFAMPTPSSFKQTVSNTKVDENVSEKKTLAESKEKADKDDKKADPKSGSFVANIGAELNIDNGEFFLDGTAFLDMGALRGSYAGNKIGNLKAQIGSSNYFWLGTPANPLAAQLDLTEEMNVQATTYLNVGKLPPSDQLVRTYPDMLHQLLGDANRKAQEKGYTPYRLFNPSEHAARLESSNGLLAGAALTIKESESTYGWFYAKIGAGAGLDVMLSDVKGNCNGQPVSVYGQGQLYLYADVNVGVNIPRYKRWGGWQMNVLPSSKGLIIGKVGFPSPMYIDGLLYGRFKYEFDIWVTTVTLVDAEYVFKVQKGTPCTPQPAIFVKREATGNEDETIIWGGTTLAREKRYYSRSKDFYLIHQNDGNLVLYNRLDQAQWSTQKFNNNSIVFQEDGNLVVYNQENRQNPVWSSSSSDKGGYGMFIQNDGNLVIYSDNNGAIWSSGTNGRQLPAHQADPTAIKDELDKGIVRFGTTLEVGRRYYSQNKKFFMKFQDDGNLVLYRADESVVWSPNTYGKGMSILKFQDDGNLVMYNSDTSRSEWSSGTYGRGGKYLLVSNDGKLQIALRVKGTNPEEVIWNSN